MTPNQIRARYMQARNDGMSHEDATNFANGVVVDSDDQNSGSGDDQKAPDLTLQSINDMKKAEIIEALEAHGVEKPEGLVDDLREQLKKIVFVDL